MSLAEDYQTMFRMHGHTLAYYEALVRELEEQIERLKAELARDRSPD